jgi:hypothetical protein
MDVYIGAPISVEEQNSYTSDEEFAKFLYEKTYALKK